MRTEKESGTHMRDINRVPGGRTRCAGEGQHTGRNPVTDPSREGEVLEGLQEPFSWLFSHNLTPSEGSDHSSDPDFEPPLPSWLNLPGQLISGPALSPFKGSYGAM